MSLVLNGGGALPFYRSLWDAGTPHAFWFDAEFPRAIYRPVTDPLSNQFVSGDAIYQHQTAPDIVSDFVWPYTIIRGTETAQRLTSDSGILVPNTSDPALWTFRGTGIVVVSLSSSSRTLVSQVTATSGSSFSNTFLYHLGFEAGTPQPVFRQVIASTTGLVIIQDRLYNRHIAAVSVSDFSWPFTFTSGATEVNRLSSDTGVLIPDPLDASRWVYQNTGTTTLILDCPVRTDTAQITTSLIGGEVIDTFTGYASDSLHQTLINTIDGRLTGKNATSALRILSIYDNTTPAYVRNTGCWAYGIDLTAISPWNSAGGVTEAGILISPRHILFATHFQIDNGATVRFVTTGNQIVARTMTGKASLSSLVSLYPDCAVGVLDSDVTSDISFARVLPDNWTGKMPGSIAAIPVLTLDQEEKALVTDLTSISASSDPSFGAMVSYQVSANPQRLAFYEDKVGGDSGNPACLIIDGKLVLLNVWTFGGAGQGTSVTYWKTGINALMTQLGGGYQLTEIDLSGYPSY